MLFLLLSAASGVFLIWKLLSKKIQFDSMKFLSIAFIAITVFFLLTIPFTQKNELYKNIEVTGVSTIKWIEDFTPKKSSFIALPKNSLTTAETGFEFTKSCGIKVSTS